MKKLLLIPILFIAAFAQAQSLCLQPYCNAIHAQVGDTVPLAAVLTATNGVASLVFTQISGPNTAVQLNPASDYKSGSVDTAKVNIAGLAVGTYIFQIIGKDLAGGVTAPKYDSIVVAAATACPAIPGPPVITGVSVPILGQTLIIPAGQGIKITFTYNGVTQTVAY